MSGRLHRHLFLCAVIVLSTCGCRNLPNEASQTSAWTDPFRRAGDTSKGGAVGVDSRARDIERNLGVR